MSLYSNVYIRRPVKDHLNGEALISNMVENHSSRSNTRKHDDSASKIMPVCCCRLIELHS